MAKGIPLGLQFHIEVLIPAQSVQLGFSDDIYGDKIILLDQI